MFQLDQQALDELNALRNQFTHPQAIMGKAAYAIACWDIFLDFINRTEPIE